MTREHEDIVAGVRQETSNAEDVRTKLISQTEELEAQLRRFREALHAAPSMPTTVIRKQHGRWRVWKW